MDKTARTSLLKKASAAHSPSISRVIQYVSHEAEFDMNGTPCNEAAELVLGVCDSLDTGFFNQHVPVQAESRIGNVRETKETDH